MKVLIIAEKSSVAKKIAQALCKNTKYYQGYVEDDAYVITQCVGHLLTLKMPQEIDEKYKSWNFDHLPFVFEKIPLQVSPKVKDQYNTVKSLLQRDDILEVVNACDPDREGELIFRNIYYTSRPKCKKITRMWIETTGSKNALIEAYNNRKDGDLYIPLYKAALARQYADYHIGLNSTRGMTSKLSNDKSVLSVGRVQTPTLNIIVDIENQIKNFVSKPFWKIVSHTDEEIDGDYVDKSLTDNRFVDKSVCQSVIDKTGTGVATITDVLVTTRQDEPRLLYNLSDLQVDMNRRYKYSAQTVLDACQSLYERHSLTTYPRTSENKISPELAAKSQMIVKGLPSIFNSQKACINDKKYVLNSKVVAKKDSIGAHEALTPVPEPNIDDSKISALSDVELNVYRAIVERFLAAFYPNAIFEKQEITFERNGSIFKNKIENLIVPGHYEAYSNFKGKETTEFLKFKKNDLVHINELEMVEGATQPPSRLTEGALLKIMTNPSKFVTDKEEKKILEETDGLGTEATRASIIEELKKREYIAMDKDKIYPTEKGIHLIEIIPSDEIKSVSLTAKFEKKLSLIAYAKYDKDIFMQEIHETERKFIEVLRTIKSDYKFDSNSNSKKSSSLCKCPVCGNEIVEGKFGWFCSNKECKCKLNYEAYSYYGHKKLNATQAKELFTSKKTKKTVALVSQKTNKSYQAYLVYNYVPGEQYPNKCTIEFESKK